MSETQQIDIVVSERDMEIARLERAVIEAAKEQRRLKRGNFTQGEFDNYIPLLHAAMLTLRDAVDALIEFESQGV